MIKNLNKTEDTTIVYTSHYMEEIEFLCDEIAILDNKKIILQDTKENLTQMKSTISIQTENQTIEIDISNSYNSFSDTIIKLKNENEKIVNINFADKNLENMFLSITKKELRD